MYLLTRLSIAFFQHFLYIVLFLFWLQATIVILFCVKNEVKKKGRGGIFSYIKVPRLFPFFIANFFACFSSLTLFFIHCCFLLVLIATNNNQPNDQNASKLFHFYKCFYPSFIHHSTTCTEKTLYSLNK
jgi:hypothetical protein